MRNHILALSIQAVTLTVFVAFSTAVLYSQDEITKKIVSERDSVRGGLTERVAKIFERSCSTSGCHGGKHPKANLSLERDKLPYYLSEAKSIQIDTLKLFDTVNPGRSYLLMKIRGDEGIKGRRMPIARPQLSAVESNAIELWIKSLKREKREAE